MRPAFQFKATSALRKFALGLVTAAFAHAAAWATSAQILVLDRDGKPVQDAVVVVVPSNTLANVPASRQLVKEQSIVNEGMAFVPNLSIVAVGSKLRIVNNDSFDHHTRGTAAGVTAFTPGATGGFELRLDGRVAGRPAASQEVVVSKAGASVLGCHMHSSMRGHVYVSESPWAGRSNAQGIVQFDDLPLGGALVKVWQADQFVDLPSQSLTLSPANTSAAPGRLEFKLQVVPRRRRG